MVKRKTSFTRRSIDSLEKIAKLKVTTRWQKMMAPYFEIIRNKTPDTMMIELEEIFHID